MLFWPALCAGVVRVNLTTAPGASLALVRLRASPAICCHGGRDEVRARARHLSLSMVAEGAPQGRRGAKIPQVVGAGCDVLSMCIEPGMVALRRGRRGLLVLLLQRRELRFSLVQMSGVG